MWNDRRDHDSIHAKISTCTIANGGSVSDHQRDLPANASVCRAVIPETLSAQRLEQYGLEEAGFKRYDRPVPGAIVLYQPGVLGSDTQAGHVEIVESVDSSGVPTISSSGPSIPAVKADAGCLNVRTSKKEKLGIAQPGVSYWRL